MHGSPDRGSHRGRLRGKAVRFKDYYETLGVARDASDADIKKAFRDLARKYHPDVSKEPQAAERFKEVNEAYEVLKDSAKRRRYDQVGHGFQGGQEFRAPPGFEDMHFDFGGGSGGPSGFSDFFEALFGRAGGGFAGGGFPGGPGGPRAAPPRKVEADLELTLAQLRSGESAQVKLRDDRGAEKSYSVRIPPGSSEGSRIRLAGQAGGGADLILRIKLAPDPRFEVEECDLKTTVDLAPWEAALGAKVTVPTVTGHVSVSIPAGTPSGRSLRLRGLGLPTAADAHGDLYVHVRIVVPEQLTDAERELFQQLADRSAFRPRGADD